MVVLGVAVAAVDRGFWNNRAEVVMVVGAAVPEVVLLASQAV